MPALPPTPAGDDVPLYCERTIVPRALGIPWSLGAALTTMVAGGATAGALAERHHALGEQVAHAIFLSSALGYATVSAVDFYEHFRLEKARTGRWLGAQVVPLGETINHALTLVVVLSLLLLARPLRAPIEARDLFVILAPALFLALGWRDEIVYHRRRANHREDILHTVAHLAVGVML
ncbi:MAG: hypothetical protein ABIP39_11360, partial [Polyangiaceae bacterium]